jgi:hypothetical protein
MNSRTRKRQIYGRYRLRGKFWLSAEDRAWDNTAPIGREFGSKDYERLEILDAFTQGQIDEQKAMRLLGLDHDALAAMVEKDRLKPRWGYGNSIFIREQCQGAVLTWPDWPNESDDDLSLAVPPVQLAPLSPARGLKELGHPMKNQLKLLQEKFPYIFSGTHIGIDIAHGWMPSFQKLCEQIDRLLGEDKRGFHWRQCKEKFGSARWYWKMKGRPTDIRIDLISGSGVIETIAKDKRSAGSDLFETISALIQEAEAHSKQAYIYCEEPGTLNKKDGYLLVLCEEHSRQRNAGTLPSIWSDENEGE